MRFWNFEFYESFRRTIAVAFFVTVSNTIVSRVNAKEGVGIIVEDYWGSAVVQQIANNPKLQGVLQPHLEVDGLHLNRFVDGTCPVVALDSYPSGNASKWIYGFPANEISKTSYIVGQAKVLVIVNRDNPLKRINNDQLQAILGKDGQNVSWTKFDGGGGKAKVYGESKKSMSREIVYATAMRKRTDEDALNFYPFGANWQECADDDVVKKVKADFTGIGFILYKGKMPADVKVLAVGRKASDPAVQPSDGPLIQPDYPLAQPLVLYLHPSPESADSADL